MNLTSFFNKAKWYEAGLDFDTDDWYERLEWCSKHFGRVGPGDKLDRKYRWAQRFNRIYFRDKEDYVWFTLRWV